jgi:hypothetical protein
VRDEFNLSASAKSMAPSLPMPLPRLSENEMKATGLLLWRWSEVRDVFDLSASAIWKAPALRIVLSVLSQNVMKQQLITAEIKFFHLVIFQILQMSPIHGEINRQYSQICVANKRLGNPDTL